MKGWLVVARQMKELKAKRYCMEKTIMEVDRQNLVREMFDHLKDATQHE